jgi:tetratricopeptide (TPR) repeat protein
MLSALANYSFAQKEDKLILEGNKLYKQKAYDKAMEAYGKAAEANPKNMKARYNLGNALFRSNQVESAEKAFDALAESAVDKEIKAQSFYNEGVTQSQQKKLPESINSYKQALRLLPDDNEARENLQKALNELKKQQQQQSAQNNQQDKNKDQQKQPENNKSKLNEKQAEKLLNGLRQEEKNIQKDLQKSKNRATKTPEKDW